MATYTSVSDWIDERFCPECGGRVGVYVDDRGMLHFGCPNRGCKARGALRCVACGVPERLYYDDAGYPAFGYCDNATCGGRVSGYGAS